MPSHEISRILLKHKAISLSVDPPFTWASGIKSPIYCDNRIILSFPESRSFVIDEFVRVISELKCDVIAGTASSGIPWAAWIADRLEKPLVYVRKATKGHGKTKRIEGTFEKGQQVIVIEDLISTGGSALSAVECVRDEGGVVTDVVAIFTYQLERAERNAKKSQVTFHTLDNFSSLVELARDDDYISSDVYDKVIKWSIDPEGWYYTYFM